MTQPRQSQVLFPDASYLYCFFVVLGVSFYSEQAICMRWCQLYAALL